MSCKAMLNVGSLLGDEEIQEKTVKRIKEVDLNKKEFNLYQLLNVVMYMSYLKEDRWVRENMQIIE